MEEAAARVARARLREGAEVVGVGERAGGEVGDREREGGSGP